MITMGNLVTLKKKAKKYMHKKVWNNLKEGRIIVVGTTNTHAMLRPESGLRCYMVEYKYLKR